MKIPRLFFGLTIGGCLLLSTTADAQTGGTGSGTGTGTGTTGSGTGTGTTSGFGSGTTGGTGTGSNSNSQGTTFGQGFTQVDTGESVENRRQNTSVLADTGSTSGGGLQSMIGGTTGGTGGVGGRAGAVGGAGNGGLGALSSLLGGFGNANGLGGNSTSTNKTRFVRAPLSLGFEIAPSQLQAFQARGEVRFRKLPRFRNGNVELATEGDTAVLRGTVKDEQSKELAERIAGFEPGVSIIKNEITVQNQ
jgi:BON domain